MRTEKGKMRAIGVATLLASMGYGSLAELSARREPLTPRWYARPVVRKPSRQRVRVICQQTMNAAESKRERKAVKLQRDYDRCLAGQRVGA